MDESILLPSPNWFLVSGMAVSSDGWVFYGGPSKSLCVLEPLGSNRNILVSEAGYRAHLFGKVHGDKVTSVDISPDWSEKKWFITGSADGGVKQWTLERVDKTVNIKYMYSHAMHSNEREDVVGVGYSTNNFAVTIGSYGRIVKWDLPSNIVKIYNLMLSKFKPTCMACSPHTCLQVAVGTKQGVVIVVDLSDSGTTLFKVRSHDDDVLSISWCPQYTVIMKKFVKEIEPKTSANKRMEKIRQEAKKFEKDELEDSALSKTLPEDSFDESIVQEEDLFDMYKDHEDDEFGHKKYTPEVIVVKEKEEKSTEFDYLAECQKLKEKILKGKDDPEPSITSLVDALDNTHVDDNNCKSDPKPKKKERKQNLDEITKQSQKHILASIGKHGQLRVWSKYGKLIGNAVIPGKPVTTTKNHQKVNQPPWGTLLWYKSDVLLITDARGQLLQCNPLITDCRNKLEWTLVDPIHKRGTFCIISNAPRVQNDPVAKTNHDDGNQEAQNRDNSNNISTLPEDQWVVWTAAQDRTVVCYSMTRRKKISSYHTCGALVYNIQSCPYDAKKVAVCVGDGAIRIWEADIDEDDDSKLTAGHVSLFWQNVQGKVLVAAWHPTRENILAFGTAEARVGILDISGHNIEKPARVLNIGLSSSVYSVCWGDRNDLYVCGGGDVVVCHFRKEWEPSTISVELDGSKWRLTAASWYPCGLMVGSSYGSVALLSNVNREILAVSFLFKKLINSIEWHPQFISSSSEESSCKNLVAVCSMDKSCRIAILKHSQDEDGKHHLETYKFLEGHKGIVMQLAWSPHDEGRLASTSSDATVRVWDIDSGTCTAIFSTHSNNPISLAWSAFPQLSNALITGGADFGVRIWKLDDYPAEAYVEPPQVPPLQRKKERKLRALTEKTAETVERNERPSEVAVDDESLYGEGREAERMSVKLKAFKKFLMPITSKQILSCTAQAAKKFIEKQFAKLGDNSGDEDSSPAYDMDFLKLFGTTNELNELLDREMEHHLEINDNDAWLMLALFRGQIDSMIQYASEKDLLCPFLVSLSPCVSFKYWKDVTQLYLAQINRFIAQKREYKLLHVRAYGGPVFRKAALLLSVHDVKGAVDCLLEARLYRDAYMLCRVRHMESIAQETLRIWVRESIVNGHLKMAIICYIALGELYEASATIAGVSKEDETWLSLAADLAKMTGQHTLAGHLEVKKEQIKQTPTNQEIEETLEQLPTRIELLLKNKVANDIKDESSDDDTTYENKSTSNSTDIDSKTENGAANLKIENDIKTETKE